MNQYGARAQNHWQRWLPSRYAKLESPDLFFEALGEEILTEVTTRAAALAGDDPPGEGYLEKAGRLRMARFDAEAEVLRELALLAPEPGADPDEEEARQDDLRAEAQRNAWSDIPLNEVDQPDHPFWKWLRDTEDDQSEDETGEPS